MMLNSRSAKTERVVVAMSGGVDSSVAAALLVEQGYEVIGIMLRLWSELAPGVPSSNKCCSLESVDDARSVANHLGIPFYLINVEQQFKEQVVGNFISEYIAAHTPNPCIVCNRTIRFGYFLDYALMLGARYLATGHYARVGISANENWQLLRGIDSTKDQSYVLHILGQHQLQHLLFPVGEYTKTQVRALAAERGLPTASRAESQDLCFVADGDYRRFLADWAPQAIHPGPILDAQGHELGRHKGLPCYTIGQRSGLGIAAPEPLYVLAMRPEDNTLIVGNATELGQDCLAAGPINWIAGTAPEEKFGCQVQIRYHAKPIKATIACRPDNTIEVRLDNPLRDITPGQSAVLYDGDICLGGGPIVRSFSGATSTS